MAKVKWETPHRGIKTKNHETRKHGIKPDKYFAVRFQFNGKRIESCLGWASDGWTLNKAIVRMQELKEGAKQGQGIKSHKQKQVEIDEERKEREKIEAEKAEEERKRTMSFGDYFQQNYFPWFRDSGRKPKTINTEEQLFRNWINPAFGGKPFADIGQLDIRRLRNALNKAKKAPRTFEYCLMLVNKVFKHAQKNNFTDIESPVSKEDKIKFDNKRVRFLTPHEAKTLLDAVRERSQQLYEMALISLHCGARAGELFGLKWKDVDIENGLITLLDTKSEKSRILPMTEDVMTAFNDKDPGGANNLVFPSKNGKKIINISQSFQRVVKTLGFNDGINDRRQRVTFHTLRHSFASWLVVDWKIMLA